MVFLMAFNPLKTLLLALISFFLVTSCASTKETVLPQDGPTMQDIYAGHMAGLYPPSAHAPGPRPLPQAGIHHYAGFVREAANEIDAIFPRLPNPTLVMYIFPHLSGEERTPVPGYVTTFPFYEKVEYALPGEVPGGPVAEPADTETGGRLAPPAAAEQHRHEK
jgi:conjugative transfer region lipoprotein (TIGR03751 family)